MNALDFVPQSGFQSGKFKNEMYGLLDIVQQEGFSIFYFEKLFFMNAIFYESGTLVIGYQILSVRCSFLYVVSPREVERFLGDGLVKVHCTLQYSSYVHFIENLSFQFHCKRN